MAPFALLMACGDSKPTAEEEVVNLESFEDRIGYALGSINAESMINGGIPQFDRLNKEMMSKGFDENLNTTDCSDCEATLLDLYGPYYQDFDSTHVDAGSTCMGRTTAFAFYRDMERMGGLDKINLDLVKVGFRHALNDKDTLIDEAQKREMIQNFILDLNVASGDKMMEAAKQEAGVEVFENGIVMKVIEEGTGGMPGATDDVEVEYILTSSIGDTIQSSYQMKQMTGKTDPVALSLDGGVIPGWSFALPKMKKGGKYQLWIPWNLAYGEQGGKQALSFMIELVNYGPKGTLFTPQPQVPQGY